jgi:hypothetical protein
MQFDVVHIVSGGVDGCVCVTDIANGEVLQSLRGHTGHILGVAFDSERILSAGGDNTMRYWQWGKRSAPSDKVHVLDHGEALVDVGKRYGVSVDNIMRWNGIIDSRSVQSGMKLIVRKGDPSVPTEAERIAAEKEQRRLAAQQLTDLRMQRNADVQHATGGKANAKFNRVHQLATQTLIRCLLAPDFIVASRKILFLTSCAWALLQQPLLSQPIKLEKVRDNRTSFLKIMWRNGVSTLALRVCACVYYIRMLNGLF